MYPSRDRRPAHSAHHTLVSSSEFITSLRKHFQHGTNHCWVYIWLLFLVQMYRAQAVSGPSASLDSDACFCCFAYVNSPTECKVIAMHFAHFCPDKILVCQFSCQDIQQCVVCRNKTLHHNFLFTAVVNIFFPYLHIFHLNSVFNNIYIFLLVFFMYFICLGSLISVSVVQQLNLTAILKLQTSEISVLCCKVLLAQRKGILSSRNRSWCSASVSVRWYYTGTDCDPENIRHLLLA